jgi:hypothetical protein
MRTDANVVLFTLSGCASRPASSRNKRDSRDVLLSNRHVTAACTSRAKSFQIRDQVAARDAKSPVGLSFELKPVRDTLLAPAAAACGARARNFGSVVRLAAGLSIIHRSAGEDEAVAPRPRISGRPAQKTSRRSGPAQSAPPLHAVRLRMRLLLAGSGERGAGSIPAVGTTSSRCEATKVAQAERASSRTAARRRRTATSTSTVAAKPALLRSGGVAPRRAHNAQTACSTQASATSARPMFVAGVRVEHDGGPAIPCVAGAAAHPPEAS